MSSSHYSENGSKTRDWWTAPIFCCKCAATPKTHRDRLFKLLNCSHIFCQDCCQPSNAGVDEVWCHVDRTHQKCMTINSQMSPRLLALLFEDSHERLQEAFNHYQSSMTRYKVLANMVCDTKIPSEAELLAAKKQVQELGEANRLHKKKETRQKLADEFEKFKIDVGKVVQAYRKQEADEKARSISPIDTDFFKVPIIIESSQSRELKSILKRRSSEDSATAGNSSNKSYRSRSSVSASGFEQSANSGSRYTNPTGGLNRSSWVETTQRHGNRITQLLRNINRPTISTRRNSSDQSYRSRFGSDLFKYIEV